MSDPKFPPMPTVLVADPLGRLAGKGAESLASIRLANSHRPPLTHVAVRLEGVVWSLPKPFRHHHILRVMHDLGVTYADGTEKDEGFLDESGRYLTRKQAFVNADLNDQIKNGKIIGGVLTSEDLW